MNIRSRSPILVVTLLLTLLLTAGCTIGGTGIDVNIQDGQFTANISIGQNILNKLITQAGANVQVDQNDFVVEVNGVDFIEPETIRFDGVFQLANGGTTAGTIDFTVAAAAGTIKLEVTAVDADGLSMETPAIRELNDELAAEFAKDVSRQRDGDHGGISAVTVTDEALKITISESLSD